MCIFVCSNARVCECMHMRPPIGGDTLSKPVSLSLSLSRARSHKHITHQTSAFRYHIKSVRVVSLSLSLSLISFSLTHFLLSLALSRSHALSLSRSLSRALSLIDQTHRHARHKMRHMYGQICMDRKTKARTGTDTHPGAEMASDVLATFRAERREHLWDL